MQTTLEPGLDPGLDEALTVEAQLWTEWHERIPARNELKREFRIGGPKAKTLRDHLVRTNPGLAGEDDPVSPAPMTYEPLMAQQVTPPEPTPEPAADPAPAPNPQPSGTIKRPGAWPLILLAFPAFVAVWSGWVGLGSLTGFGLVHPLPGIYDKFTINSAITLPIGVEAYAAYAIRIWLSDLVSERARRFARASSIGALAFGALGQIAYHLMAAAHMTSAPWPVTILVACLPITVVGAGSSLYHFVRSGEAGQ